MGLRELCSDCPSTQSAHTYPGSPGACAHTEHDPTPGDPAHTQHAPGPRHLEPVHTRAHSTLLGPHSLELVWTHMHCAHTWSTPHILCHPESVHFSMHVRSHAPATQPSPGQLKHVLSLSHNPTPSPPTVCHSGHVHAERNPGLSGAHAGMWTVAKAHAG